MPDSLIPGAHLSEANPYGFDLRRPPVSLHTLPGGGTYSNPEYGAKMPSDKQAETDAAIERNNATKEAEAKRNPFFSFLGVETSWKEVGVYTVLLILFLVGVIGLLGASGMVNVEPGGLTVKGVRKVVKLGK